MIICPECNKEIYAVTKLETKKGIEVPTLIHAVCYERLKRIEEDYLEDDNDSFDFLDS